MIQFEARKKLAMSVSVTESDCDVRSDSVRAISVTLRSTATPDENSTVPKNITSITGMMKANSVAARPRRSASMRSQCRTKDFMGLVLERFILEDRRCLQQHLLVGQVREIEAKPGDESRPLIEQPDHDQIAGAAR